MKQEEFKLTTLKVLKGKVVINYYDEKYPKETFNSENKDKAHPDLKDSLGFLKDAFKSVFSLSDKQVVDIIGINLKENKSGNTVQILGMFTSVGGPCSLNSKDINYEGDKLGIEEELLKAVEVIVGEAWEYKFNNKRSQLTMDLDNEQTEEAESESEKIQEDNKIKQIDDSPKKEIKSNNYGRGN